MHVLVSLSLSLSLSPSLSPETAPLPVSILKQTEWLRAMLFNRSSCSARTMAYGILLSLCKGDERRRQILVLLSRYSACTYVYLYSSLSPPLSLSLSLSSFLDEVATAGEASEEFLGIFTKLMKDSTGQWKVYLAQRGVLLQIGSLIEKVLISSTVNTCIMMNLFIYTVHLCTYFFIFFCEYCRRLVTYVNWKRRHLVLICRKVMLLKCSLVS